MSVTSSAMEPTASLGQYGKHFQECVVQAMLSDRNFASALLEVFDPNYFELNYLRFLADRYFVYAKKYKVFPTLQLLVTIIKDELKVGTDALLRDQIVEYLQRMRANPCTEDASYVKERTLDFMRKQALKIALVGAVDLINVEKYEQVVDLIKKAVVVGTTPSLGHDFFQDHESRFTRLQRNTIATGLDALDRKEIFQGGVGAGEFAIIVGSPGAGKSHFLIQIGANALRQNVDVLHYTMELSEANVGIRYDSNLCDLDSNEVIDNKEQVLKTYGENKYGRLIIKEFPPNFATIHTFRAHIERLDLKGFHPGLIIIDSPDNMRSTRQFDSLRHELKLIYEELRGFAGEKKIPFWGCSQSNKEGANSEVIDLTNMSEAYGKAMVADVVLSISRKSQEKATGLGRLYVAKNRLGRDGLVFPMMIDTARSKFAITGRAMGLEDASNEDEDEVKKALRKKWKELKDAPFAASFTVPQPQP